jgi:hypothetical protein
MVMFELSLEPFAVWLILNIDVVWEVKEKLQLRAENDVRLP